LVLNYDGVVFPSVTSPFYINITGSLSVNSTARPQMDEKHPIVTVTPIESSQQILGKFLKISATANYTLENEKCDKITFKEGYSDFSLHLNMTYETASCNEDLSTGAVIGIMIAIIAAIVITVVGSHLWEERKKH
jgi:negative regulator of sigma E activity